MAKLISYIKRLFKGSWNNFKDALSDSRRIDAPFLAEDLLQKLNNLSPRSDQALVAVVEFFQNISDTTDTIALLPQDHADRSKATPDRGGLRYVLNQHIETITSLFYFLVQRRSPKNAIPLPGEAKRG
ncbi:hypothetical protein O181_109619 [Austropuccinia psidii MF-1]|uniref:Uncharacterized protein n=1 Tax=Austropuccinia psidii MF-1 TaxID=1389203 RepID=A0A9Q3JYF5_9BASI|nr:hypothetical protein [Austropuccinia psidii MF-1]